jgi:hypothetical protein
LLVDRKRQIFGHRRGIFIEGNEGNKDAKNGRNVKKRGERNLKFEISNQTAQSKSKGEGILRRRK